MSEWISVKDRLPEVRAVVLVYANNKIYVSGIAALNDYGDGLHNWYCVNDYESIDQDITHWMPLPDPPE